MLKSQKLQIESSEKRQRANELLGKDTLTGEERTELEGLTGRLQEIEVEYRAALVVEGAELEQAKAAAGDGDAEMRERIELRSKASLTNYLLAAARGRLPDGAEHELAAAAGVQGIPLELWDVPERRSAEGRAVTEAPGTVGVNLDPIRPAVFAHSIVPSLGVDMPRVGSGTFATATITTSTTAGARAKSADAPATAAAFTLQTATPKRVGARLELAAEDIAAIGQANFEGILRQNLSLALSDELDKQALNGDGTAPNLSGILTRLTTPPAPTNVADFDAFVATFADGIDGLWANTAKDIAIVCGVDTYKLSAKTFRDATGQDLGDTSFADYATSNFGAWRTNKRMPAASASNVQAGILYRKGRSMAGGSGAMRTAVCPHWGEISIDDIYSGSSRAERYFTMHALLGDILLVQPDAYSEVLFKVA